LLLNESSPRLPALDGLRGIAILLVLVWHYFVCLLKAEPGSTTAYALACLRLTWSGVDLFFVLSGFLIGGILLDNRHSANCFKVFYIRRICRILPLYFLLLILFVVLLQSAPTTLSWLLKDPQPLWSYATFTQNFAIAFRNDWGSHWNAITWSLAIEEQFYLILPFVIRYWEPRKLPRLLIGAIAAAPLLRILLNHWRGEGDVFLAVYVLTPCRMDALLLGVFCAWIVRQKKFQEFLLTDQAKKVLHASFAILLIGAAFLTIKFPGMTSYAMSAFGYSWIALLYACLLLIVVTQKRSLLHYISSNGPLQRLGVISYGIYLLHQGTLGLTHGLILHQAPTIADVTGLLVTLLALALTVSVGVLSYNFFERPIVAIGHSFHYQGSTTLLGARSIRQLRLPFAAEQFARVRLRLGDRRSRP
jgi:peptidoglycan/LPS O-acetylase OafA/YrhL